MELNLLSRTHACVLLAVTTLLVQQVGLRYNLITIRPGMNWVHCAVHVHKMLKGSAFTEFGEPFGFSKIVYV
jgi:hypothetical protein